MDKYEYQVCADQIKHLIEERRFAEAMNIADTIDWRKVRSVSMLCTVSEVYKINKKYEEARDILLLAYDRHPNGRTIVYALCELAIKLNDVLQAKGLYEEFVSLAPEDTSKYILLYKLYEALDVSIEERIEVLEEFKKRDYRERWAYELAYLYHKIGQETRCVQECDELILWFGDGKYVKKAMDLKMQHTRLSKEQQLKYEGRQEPLNDKFMNMQNTPVQQIYDTDPQAGNPQEIPIQRPYDQQYDPYRQMQHTPSGMTGAPMMQNTPVGMQGAPMMQNTPVGMPGAPMMQNTPAGMQQMMPGQDPNGMQLSAQPVGAPIQQTAQMLTTSEIDSIQVQPVNVGMYNTMDLQNGLSENIKEFFEKESVRPIDNGVALSADPRAYEQLYENDTMDVEPVQNEPVISVGGIVAAENELDDTPESDEDNQITTYMPINAEIVGGQDSEEAYTDSTAEDTEDLPVEDKEDTGLNTEDANEEPKEEIAEKSEPEYELDEEDKDDNTLSDIYKDWDEKKKENEERRILEAKEKSLVQTNDIMAKLKGVLPEIDDIARPTPTIEPVVTPYFIPPVQEASKAASVSIPLPVEEVAQAENEADEIDFAAVPEKPEAEEPVEEPAEAPGVYVATEEESEETEEEHVEEEEPVEETEPEEPEEEPAGAEEPVEETEPEEPEEEPAETEEPVAETETEEQEEEPAETEEPLAETEKEEPEEEPAKMEEPVEETEPEEPEEEPAEAEEPVAETEKEEPEEPEEEEAADTTEPVEAPVVEEKPVIRNTPWKEVPEEDEADFIDKAVEEVIAKHDKSEVRKDEEEFELDKIEIKAGAIKGEFDYLNAKSNDELYFKEIMDIDDSEEGVPVNEEGLTFTEDEEAARKAAFEITSELPKYPYEGLEDYGEVEEIEVIEQPEGLDGVLKTDDIPLDDIARANYEAGVSDSAEEDQEEKKEPAKKKHPKYMKIEKAPSSKRDFDKEEKLVFGRFEGIEWLKAEIVNAIDNISMEPSHGNVVVVGTESSGRRNIAIDIVRVMQQLENGFKGKVAKISGEALNKKDIPLTVKKLKKGALIIENAQDLTPSSARIVAEALELETEHVLVVMEGDKEGMETLFDSSRAIMDRVFNARIELQDYTTDDLVAYGKGYAKEQEYVIDDMGVLAMYRRIGDMQTLEHAVTLEEVREIVDNAIKHVDKKNMSHFMDVLLAKRYDDDDYIILREKDFI